MAEDASIDQKTEEPSAKRIQDAEGTRELCPQPGADFRFRSACLLSCRSPWPVRSAPDI